MSTKQEHAVTHTPTPWRLGHGGDTVFSETTNGDIVADCFGEKANAALIVRAVNAHTELVAALEAVLPNLDRHDQDMVHDTLRKAGVES